MLAGLKLVLGRFRLFNAPADQRLGYDRIWWMRGVVAYPR